MKKTKPVEAAKKVARLTETDLQEVRGGGDTFKSPFNKSGWIGDTTKDALTP